MSFKNEEKGGDTVNEEAEYPPFNVGMMEM